MRFSEPQKGIFVNYFQSAHLKKSEGEKPILGLQATSLFVPAILGLAVFAVDS